MKLDIYIDDIRQVDSFQGLVDLLVKLVKREAQSV
jgi:hypothetical protein